MKNKEKLAEDYIEYLYGEEKDNLIYAPDVQQSKIDFLAGYEAGQSKWIDTNKQTPEEGERVILWIKNTQFPHWSVPGIGHYENNNWYVKGGRESNEIVEKWFKFPE